MKVPKTILLYLFIALAVLALRAGIIENKSALKTEIAIRAYSKAFTCDNKMKPEDWGRIAYPEMIKFHDRNFYDAVNRAAKKYGSNCLEAASAECTNDVVGYIATNSYKLLSFVKSECINPFVPPEIQTAAYAVATGKEAKRNGYLSNFAVNFTLNFKSVRDTISQLFLAVPIEGIDYNRKIKVHYWRYDKDGKNWGLHLFKSPWGDVTNFNEPLMPSIVQGCQSTFEVDLKKFKGSPDLNFVVHNGNEKDMFGLDVHWPISEKSEIWIVENQTEVFTTEEAAKKIYNSGSNGKFSIYFYKEDADYNGWSIHIWNPENNRSYTDWFSSLSGTLDGGYLRFDISPKLIGLLKKIGFVIHKQNLKSSQVDYVWKIAPRKNLIVKYGETHFTEKPSN